MASRGNMRSECWTDTLYDDRRQKEYGSSGVPAEFWTRLMGSNELSGGQLGDAGHLQPTASIKYEFRHSGVIYYHARRSLSLSFSEMFLEGVVAGLAFALCAFFFARSRCPADTPFSCQCGMH
jgi:hypothetical protein